FASKEIFQIYPDQFVGNAHNEFLTIAAELGIIGLAIFLWFLLRVFLLAKKNIKSQDRYLKTASIAAISSVTGIIFINLFDVSLRFTFTALFWWLAIAVLVVSNKLE
ncbi:MAG: O-antigen ligase family protein, partial [Candidatus Omnitrophica bacterium]|nr:O-antigen ligase family protein [Candidatus Omnitrophota bacterium]